MKDRTAQVLKLLIEGEEEFNISKLSRLSGIDYKNTYSIVKRLSSEGLVILEKFGNTVRCSLNRKNHPLIFRVEYERREELLKDKNMAVLYNKLNRLPFPMVALIFGSYARGQARKGSDIDLMVICEKNREEEVERTISLLPLSIHLTLLTWDEFLSMARSREFSVVSEALKRNIILIGIEDYYRLVEHAG